MPVYAPGPYVPAAETGPTVNSEGTAIGEQPTIIVEDADDEEQSPEYEDSN